MIKILFRIIIFLLLISFLFLISSCMPEKIPETSSHSHTSETETDEILSSVPEKIENNTSELQYKETKTDDLTEKKTDIYTDSQGNQYIYGADDGKIKGFYKGIDSSSISSEIKNEDELKTIAENFIENYIELNKYNFVSRTYADDTKVSTYNFNRLINGYNSADFAFVMLKDDGSIIGYAAPNIGIFDNIRVPEINENKAIQTLEEIMKLKYDYSQYKIETKRLVVNSKNKCELSFSVTMTFDEESKQRDTFNVPIE